MENNRYKEKVRLAVYNDTKESGEHFHQDIELLYVMEGTLDMIMGEQTVHMKEDDILVVNANKKHSVKGSENILIAQLMMN